MSQVNIQCSAFTGQSQGVGKTSNQKWPPLIWHFLVIGKFIFPRMQCQTYIYIYIYIYIYKNTLGLRLIIIFISTAMSIIR